MFTAATTSATATVLYLVAWVSCLAIMPANGLYLDKYEPVPSSSSLDGSIALCGNIVEGCLSAPVCDREGHNEEHVWSDNACGKKDPMLGAMEHIGTAYQQWTYGPGGLLKTKVPFVQYYTGTQMERCLGPTMDLAGQPLSEDCTYPLTLRECPSEVVGPVYNDNDGSSSTTLDQQALSRFATRPMRFLLTEDNRVQSLAPVVNGRGEDISHSHPYCVTIKGNHFTGSAGAALVLQRCSSSSNTNNNNNETEQSSRAMQQDISVYGSLPASGSFVMPLQPVFGYGDVVHTAYHVGGGDDGQHAEPGSSSSYLLVTAEDDDQDADVTAPPAQSSIKTPLMSRSGIVSLSMSKDVTGAVQVSLMTEEEGNLPRQASIASFEVTPQQSANNATVLIASLIAVGVAALSLLLVAVVVVVSHRHHAAVVVAMKQNPAPTEKGKDLELRSDSDETDNMTVKSDGEAGYV